jgi:UDP-N-acetylglucosamine 2-epimerase (non-hydrolysing)
MDENLIIEETSRLLTEPAEYDRAAHAVNPYGDGRASERIVGALLYYFGIYDVKPEEFNVKALG